MAAIDTILAPGADVSKLDLRRYLSGREMAVPEDHGGVGDGLVDDQPAIMAALAAGGTVFLRPGTWRVASTIILSEGQALIGAGPATILTADDLTYPVVEIRGGNCRVAHMKIDKGKAGVRLVGGYEFVQRCVCQDLELRDNEVGLELDGGSGVTWPPVFWNHFVQILIRRPRRYGVWLHTTEPGSLDTPNANKFFDVRSWSEGQAISGGSGLYCEHGNFMNAWVDCEFNAPEDAHSCVRIGPNTQTNAFVNLYTESQFAVANVYLDTGSKDTLIYNGFLQSGGGAIVDEEGARNYTVLNGGFPDAFFLPRQARATNLIAERFRYDTEFLDLAPGTHQLDLASSCYFIGAFTGDVTAELPEPSADNNGQQVIIKKTDPSEYSVTVTAQTVTGPDNAAVILASQYDFVTVVSNGASWFVVSKNVQTSG
ncbi:MAG: hypothetical protein GVY13_15540 [Alphaproteobacteria bacterium]|jgi:hypothetical protein|nr:hypothetical protein [Alphaproteobacteria bacterium]